MATLKHKLDPSSDFTCGVLVSNFSDEQKKPITVEKLMDVFPSKKKEKKGEHLF